ncbi:hypothetical protein BH23VER1_BH23VER1_12100 [soil metagenome]
MDSSGRVPRSPSSRASRRPSRHADLQAPVELKNEEFLLGLVRRTPDVFLLVLDHVQDPHNLGACLRSADAAGVHAVVIPKDRSVGITDTVRHVASGAAEHVPVVQVTNLARALKALKGLGVWLTGTADGAAQEIYDLDLTGPFCLVMGAEGEGLRRLTAESCDHLARIPMAGKVGCLNVSVATGVCLFEAVRQRTRKDRKAPPGRVPPGLL